MVDVNVALSFPMDENEVVAPVVQCCSSAENLEGTNMQLHLARRFYDTISNFK